jgi:uncharacterized integral membrane protein
LFVCLFLFWVCFFLFFLGFFVFVFGNTKSVELELLLHTCMLRFLKYIKRDKDKL